MFFLPQMHNNNNNEKSNETVFINFIIDMRIHGEIRATVFVQCNSILRLSAEVYNSGKCN